MNAVSADRVFDVQTREDESDDRGGDVDRDEKSPIRSPNGLEADGRGQSEKRKRDDAQFALDLIRDHRPAEFVEHGSHVRVGGRQRCSAQHPVEPDESLEAAAGQPGPRAVLGHRQQNQRPVRSGQMAPRQDAREAGEGEFLEVNGRGDKKTENEEQQR